jgi:hypothetical protein
MMKKKVLLVGVAMMLVAGFAMAQTADFNNSPQSMTITGTVGQVQRIDLPGDQAFDLTGSSANGEVVLGDMTVFSNVGYTVTIDTEVTSFVLNSADVGESLPYDLTVGGNTVDESTGEVVPSRARSSSGGETYTIVLTYVQDEADILTAATDYTDTLAFSIASP